MTRDKQLWLIEPDLPSPELTEWDQQAYTRITSTDLTPEQKNRIIDPPRVFPHQASVLAVHWHPEFIPLELVQQRIRKTFPNSERELIIPTQHNVLMSSGRFSGVEADCYAREFDRKIQLLLHLENAKLEKASGLQSMLAHTFKYRSSQLMEYLETIIEPSKEDRMQKAALQTGANKQLVAFVRAHAAKLMKLIVHNESITPPFMMRNKMVESYFNELRSFYDNRLVNRAQVFLKAVKAIVKAHFSNLYFYQVQEIIEEARHLGAGIIVPHPEQFWPVLLTDYDVDGYEVWNPQSRQYTDLLIDFVIRQNKGGTTPRRLLIFMGDDTHMSEKAREIRMQDPEKAKREVGLQPAWDDDAIHTRLIKVGLDRTRLIEEYEARLGIKG